MCCVFVGSTSLKLTGRVSVGSCAITAAALMMSSRKSGTFIVRVASSYAYDHMCHDMAPIL